MLEPPPPSTDVVPIPAASVNYRDLLFKVFWTTVAIGLGLLGTAVVEVHPAYAVPIGGAVNYITGLIRQFYGVTPPDISHPAPTSLGRPMWPSD